MKTNLHIITSPFGEANESRTFRSIQTILKHNLFEKVLVIGLKEDPDDSDEKELNSITTLHRVFRGLEVEGSSFYSKTYKTLSWSFEVFKIASKEEVHTLNCHSLSLLPLSVALKFKMSCKLIYDIHELETEVSGIGKFRKITTR